MSSSAAVDTVVSRLCRISRQNFVDPFKTLSWPETLDADCCCFSPELISIYGMPEYEALGEGQRKRLALHEALNFFSLNIHGEKALIEGLAHHLYLRDDPQISPYLHHFLDEENKHMIYFARFCTQYGGKIYPNKKMVFLREYAIGEEEFLFFAKVMIFEETVNVYNKSMAADKRLAPIAREIQRMHHVDESRHLAFGRAIVKWLFERYAPDWSPSTLQAVRDYIACYFGLVWREYYNADVYRDLSLADPYGLAQRAFERADARAHRARTSEACVRYLLNHEILLEEPAL